jgi:hypothetical protein
VSSRDVIIVCCYLTTKILSDWLNLEPFSVIYGENDEIIIIDS